MWAVVEDKLGIEARHGEMRAETKGRSINKNTTSRCRERAKQASCPVQVPLLAPVPPLATCIFPGRTRNTSTQVVIKSSQSTAPPSPSPAQP